MVAVNQTLVLPILVLSAVLVLPSVWLTWKVVKVVLKVVMFTGPMPTHVDQNSGPISGEVVVSSRSNRITNNNNHKKKKKTLRWNVYCSAVCSICYTTSIILLLIRESILFQRVSYDLNNDQRIHHILYSSMTMSNVYNIFVLIYGLASVMLALVCFHRMILTFEQSQYRLNDNSKKIGIFWMCVCIVLYAAMVPSFAMKQSLLTLLLILPVFISYPFFFTWLAFRFLNTTRIIAEEVRQFTHDRFSSDRTQILVDASLRLTIVTIIATISSVFTQILSVIAMTVHMRLRVHIVAQLLDCFINLYCLVCTYRENEDYYHWFLGWFHRWLLDKLTLN